MEKIANTYTRKRTLVVGIVASALYLLIAVAALVISFMFRAAFDNESGSGVGAIFGALGYIVFLFVGIVFAVGFVFVFIDYFRAKKNVYGIFPLIFILASIALVVALIVSAVKGGLQDFAAYLVAIFAVIPGAVYSFMRMADRRAFVGGDNRQ